MIRTPFPTHFAAAALSDRLVITLPAHRNWFVVAAFGAWELACLGVDLSLLGSALGGSGAEQASASAEESLAYEMFTLLLCVVWTYGGGIALQCLLWQLTGREVVEVSPAGIRLARVMLGHTEEKMYRAERIHKLRVSPIAHLSNGCGKPPQLYCSVGTLAFTYGDETIWFGTNDLAESARVIKAIRPHYARYMS